MSPGGKVGKRSRFRGVGEAMQIGYKLASEGFGPKELIRQAVRAEEVGFDPLRALG
ncbi:hypothetical protein TPA0908_04780 [Micromonospora sp. AKA38]|nr:hypothetical protein TPA0908_04780 [Micromonospora sp. AKA38]